MSIKHMNEHKKENDLAEESTPGLGDASFTISFKKAISWSFGLTCFGVVVFSIITHFIKPYVGEDGIIDLTGVPIFGGVIGIVCAAYYLGKRCRLSAIFAGIPIGSIAGFLVGVIPFAIVSPPRQPDISDDVPQHVNAVENVGTNSALSALTEDEFLQEMLRRGVYRTVYDFMAMYNSRGTRYRDDNDYDEIGRIIQVAIPLEQNCIWESSNAKKKIYDLKAGVCREASITETHLQQETVLIAP